jgi:hypothetical protein
MLGGIIMLKLIHKQKLLPFNWSIKKYYVLTVYGALIIWIIPALIFLLFSGSEGLKNSFNNYDYL